MNRSLIVDQGNLKSSFLFHFVIINRFYDVLYGMQSVLTCSFCSENHIIGNNVLHYAVGADISVRIDFVTTHRKELGGQQLRQVFFGGNRIALHH